MLSMATLCLEPDGRHHQKPQGIQLCHPDEIELPGDSASQALRSDQVSDGAVGYAFCNQVALAPKLRARGGSYLLLIVPGELGHDLRQQLNDVSVNLVGNSFCMTLTCFDPVAKKAFPRKVVCINLGLQNCKAAELKPHVQVDADDSQIVCVNAYAKYNRDDWHELCSQNNKMIRSQVIQSINKILKTTTVDLWGIRVEHNKQILSCFVRVPKEKAQLLYDSKHP